MSGRVPGTTVGAAALAHAGRAVAGAALLLAIALLPWLSRTDPARTVLHARSAEREPTPEVLAAVREQLGLDAGPLRLFGRWLGGLLHGDAGTSWISGAPVLPAVRDGLGVSATLVLAAAPVAVLTAALLTAPALRRGGLRRTARRTAGLAAALPAALPEFLLAAVLAAVLAVRLGWFPAVGWEGPSWTVLPALSLGVPTGAFLARLLDDALPAAFAEPWARAATAAGMPARRIAAHAMRRCLPALLPNAALTAVGLLGGAVAVENVFAIPGLGRLTLQAALAQDLPVLQTGALALLLLGAAAGLLARTAGRLLLGSAPAARALPALHRPPLPAGRVRAVAALLAALLLATTVAGLLRDPYAIDTAARLAGPSAAHPLGADALGRDLLARLGHGALHTTGLAAAVTAATLPLGLLLGLLPRLSAGLAETANAVPPVLCGLLAAGALGSGPYGAALAVAAVGWAPLAVHTAALVEQQRAATHLEAGRALGAGRWHLLRRHLLPAVLPPVARHAVLRLPGTALALASLGFLGLGSAPPAPDWGLLLSENLPYAERAPWAVLAPGAALCLLGALAVALAAAAGSGAAGSGRRAPGGGRGSGPGRRRGGLVSGEW
ncbi:ABC transporter permease subunit [Peterkaempfera bronchialis]|uniref:ABC transporter permease subunit n=1 Tax=Peterkaempfera bronchialis TaxID=2126346 RepID=UPI003C2F006C